MAEAISQAVVTVLSTRSQDYFAQLGGVPARDGAQPDAGYACAAAAAGSLGIVIRVGLGWRLALGWRCGTYLILFCAAARKWRRSDSLRGHDSRK